MDLLPINTIDLVVLLLVIGAAVMGFRSGAIPQVLGLVAVGVAIALIVTFAPQITVALAGIEQPARALVAIGGAFLIVAMAQAIGSGLGVTVRNLVGGVAGGIDSTLGAFLGAAQALLVTWLVGGLLAVSALPVVSGIAQESVAVRWLLEVLPPPGEVIGKVGTIIDESGLPQVFSGLEPLPAAPIDLPADAETAAIAARAIASTVRVDCRPAARRSPAPPSPWRRATSSRTRTSSPVPRSHAAGRGGLGARHGRAVRPRPRRGSRSGRSCACPASSSLPRLPRGAPSAQRSATRTAGGWPSCPPW